MMTRRLPAVRRGPFLLETSLPRWVDEFFREFDRTTCEAPVASFGRTDIYEKDRALVFETELPGVKKDEVAIKIEKGSLVVSGEVKRDEQIDRKSYFRMGRQVGQFQRSFPLPVDKIDKTGITAKFTDGILRITAPLKESIKEKEQPIEIPVE